MMRLTALALVAACSSSPSGVDLTKPVHVDLGKTPPQKLSAWNLFVWDPAVGFTWNETDERIVPYDVNTALFSDYALKVRAIYIPPDASATYDPEAAFDLPVGSVLMKTFLFPADYRAPGDNVTLVETRLLVRHDDGWHPFPYIWNAEQTDAVYSPSGDVRELSFVDESGAPQTANYLIPQRNQCENCHGSTVTPIGIKARHLSRGNDYGAGLQNQLDRMTELGMLTGAPPVSSITPAYDFRFIEGNGVAAIPPADIEPAARSYLDINCAHCHSPTGVQGITSQLFLNHDNTDAFHLGECKRPGSAAVGTGGFTFDIVPGDPDTSILYFRVHTTQVGAMMPLLGRSLEHTRGSELIHAWIAAMPPNDCSGL